MSSHFDIYKYNLNLRKQNKLHSLAGLHTRCYCDCTILQYVHEYFQLKETVHSPARGKGYVVIKLKENPSLFTQEFAQPNKIQGRSENYWKFSELRMKDNERCNKYYRHPLAPPAYALLQRSPNSRTKNVKHAESLFPCVNISSTILDTASPRTYKHNHKTTHISVIFYFKLGNFSPIQSFNQCMIIALP